MRVGVCMVDVIEATRRYIPYAQAAATALGAGTRGSGLLGAGRDAAW